MKLRFGPKTITLNTFRFPRTVPGLHPVTPIRIPMPKVLRIGGNKAAFLSVGFVAAGFLATIFMVVATDKTEILWPTAGAEYNLPNTVGQKLPSDDHTPLDPSMTLRINLADNVRLDKLHLKNLDLGKSGLSNSFEINRSTGVTGAMVNVGVFTVTNSSAPSLDWANMEVGTLVMAAKTDGHTNSAVIDSTINNLVVDSDRGAGSYVAENSIVDRVIISLNGDNGATIGEVVVDGVTASVGAFDWDYLRIGTLTLDGTNQFGRGDGINESDFIVQNTVKSRSITDNLIDTPLKVQ